MIQGQTKSGQRGVTALFTVIFATLLLSIITLSFITAMVREQVRSIDDELSESAYDSALAGVEDGKRVLHACSEGDVDACTAIAAEECDTVSRARIASAVDGEVLIQSSSDGSGEELNQAYTCVKIDRNTRDYIGEQGVGESTMIPLRSVRGFDRLVISWHTVEDGSYELSNGAEAQLLPFNLWRSPALIKMQFMQYNGAQPIDQSAFDQNDGAHAAFLYPKTIASNPVLSLIDDRSVGKSQPAVAECRAGGAPIAGYACTVELEIPDMNDRVAYVRLTALYRQTHFQIMLKNDAGNIVDFANVQPTVDSTGRANDVYRRVEARVEKTSANADSLYPRATVDISNNFCKDFSVTDDDYLAGSCDPTKSGD